MSKGNKKFKDDSGAKLDLYSTLVSLDALMEMEGPLADLAKSGLILLPIGKGNPPLMTRVSVGLVLEAFLSKHPERRDYFYFTKNIGGLAAVVVGESSLYATGKKACLLRAAKNASELASGIRHLPQPVVIIRWNAWDEEVREGARKVAAAIISENPGFRLFERPHYSAIYLSNHTSCHDFFHD